jgi:cytochrome c peroxidase
MECRRRSYLGAGHYRTWGKVAACLALLAAVLLMPAREHLNAGEERAAPSPFAAEPITRIEAPTGLDPAKVRLGERLFSDVRVSHRDRFACITCHQLDNGGADHRDFSLSPETGGMLDHNTPTIFNAVLNFRFNWSGQFRDVAEQNEFIILSPRLMNTNWVELITKLRADSEYRSAFEKAYGGSIHAEQVLDALVSYELSLVTPNARFDRYLRGERDAITSEEEEGYQLFKAFGCVACHQGMNVGGNLFERFGIFEAASLPANPSRQGDLGRFDITGQERDRFVFRVPSLRNVALTAPYFHDGSAATLGAAVSVMARKQLGRTLEDAEVDLLVGFLKTLTGEYGGRPLDRPAAGDEP